MVNPRFRTNAIVTITAPMDWDETTPLDPEDFWIDFSAHLSGKVMLVDPVVTIETGVTP